MKRHIKKMLLLLVVLVLSIATNAYSKAMNDFDGDNNSDVLWYNIDSGDVSTWQMNGKAINKPSPLATVSELNWQILGAGDFDKDGKSDILWQNTSTGEVAVWLQNGAQKLPVLTFAGTKWEVRGIGDFDGDGKSDVLWQDKTTGDICIWLMDGGTIKTNKVVTVSGGGGGTLVPGWQVKAVGDLDGDGKSDILWQNTVTYAISIWFVDGVTVKSTATPTQQPDINWLISGTGDFDKDGKSDILWQNSKTGMVYIWFMDGAAIKSASGTPGTLTSWQVQDIGDYDGDGYSDILWYNLATNDLAVWLMNGVTIKDKAIATRFSRGNWRSIPNGSNIMTLFNAGISTSNLSPSQGYSSTRVTITGSGFTASSQVTFGSYASNDVMFISENRLVVHVPFAVTDDKVSGLPQGVYPVSVDGKAVGNFSVLALPNNPNPPGVVLNNTLGAVTDAFVSDKEAIQSAIASMKSSTTDADVIGFLDEMNSALPDLESFLRNEASSYVGQIDPTTLATIEQTLLANSRLVDFKEASPGAPQGSLLTKSTVSNRGQSCDVIGGDAWLEGRARLVDKLYWHDVIDMPLSACGWIPVVGCGCKVVKALHLMISANRFLKFAEYGTISGLKFDADYGKEGTPTDELLTLKLALNQASTLQPYVKTSLNGSVVVPAGFIAQAFDVVGGCLVPESLKRAFIAAKYAVKLGSKTLYEDEEPCSISLSKVQRSKIGDPYGKYLSVTDNGQISWAGIPKRIIDAGIGIETIDQFKIKASYMIPTERIVGKIKGTVLGDYMVNVKYNPTAPKPALTVDKNTGAAGETFTFTGTGFSWGGGVVFHIAGPQTFIVGRTADNNGGISYSYSFSAAGTYTITATDDVSNISASPVSITVSGTTGNRFTDNGDGSMTDKYTNLVWMKDANPCGATTWADAATCVGTLGDGGWKVPTIQELYTLCREDGTTTGLNLSASSWYICNGTAVDRATQLGSEGFTNVQSNYYWSSTSYANDTSYAWVVSMYDGHVYANVKSFYGYEWSYVWPVRSGH
ncbi:MAG: FG-GAP-like repeat-containing protein [Candidatus Magnetobacterium sp. LHC-1]